MIKCKFGKKVFDIIDLFTNCFFSSSVYISFGGLLLCLEGGYRNLSSLKQENIYLLMRR